jgi:nucleoside-diphosphate-sugar epimerase
MSSTRSMQKRILIIGANGLLGRIISQHLSKLGNILYGIDKIPEDEPSPRFQLEHNEKSQLLEKTFPGIFSLADITDEEALREAIVNFGKIDVVIVLAAALENQTPDVIKAVNENGIKNIYKVCIQQSINRVILTSSMMVLWDKYTNEEPYSLIKNNIYKEKYDLFKKITETEIFVESPVGETLAVAAYKNSKINMEKMAEQYIREDITTICMRVGSVNTQNQLPKEHTWAWTSHNDLCRFIELAVNYLVSPFLGKAHFLPLFLCSDNKQCIVSLTKAKETIGFVPHEGTNKIAKQNKIFKPVEDEPEGTEPDFMKLRVAKL